jgi:hypothetical protein
MSRYTTKAVQDIISKYVERGGEVIEVVEGVLGYGTTICFGDGLKFCVIQEHFVNAWSSNHSIRLYNKLPKKYEALIEEYL